VIQFKETFKGTDSHNPVRLPPVTMSK
jgi:hypothetical protein